MVTAIGVVIREINCLCLSRVSRVVSVRAMSHMCIRDDKDGFTPADLVPSLKAQREGRDA
jgi:hypothetical protein